MISTNDWATLMLCVFEKSKKVMPDVYYILPDAVKLSFYLGSLVPSLPLLKSSKHTPQDI